MYSDELIELVKNVDNKSYMISLSLNKEKKSKIIEATSWMSTFYPTLHLKTRCIAIRLDYTEHTFPKCPNCDNPVGYDKVYLSSFNKFCSNKCSKEYGRLSDYAKECLNSYDWMYQKRIIERVSYNNIGYLLGCSMVPPSNAAVKLGIPLIKLNESSSDVKEILYDREFLYNEHVINRKQVERIGKEIGSSGSTISIFLRKHGIETNKANSYDREHGKSSKESLEVFDYILSLEVDAKLNNRSILGGKEIDIFIPSLNIGFEYNGVYSHIHKHSEDVITKEKNYHLEKTVNALKKGVKLFHIFSDDWMLNKDVMKSVIAAKLGIFNKVVYARKCSIVELNVAEKTMFLNANHIQGKDRSSISYALNYNDEIVAVITFCKSRYNKSAVWELSRFCVLKHTKVIGGFSKLLKHFRKKYTGNIISYADRCYSFGEVYSKNGFTLLNTNPPSYKYVNLSKSLKRLHRSNFMKKTIAPNDPRPEHQIMLERGYCQIYDCGTFAYLLK